MKASVLKLCSFICIIVVVVFSTPSCKKDKTCHGKVHVIDTTGTPVGLATVKLDAPNSDVKYTGTTDGSGDVTFEVTLPAIFNVTATKSTLPGLVGLGVIRLDEPGKSAEVTVTMQ